MTATYSPEDNKLRLYSLSRLPKDVYERVKAAGFKWAPKQDLFVAPTWSPSREDLLIELCGEIGDEDTSLVDRAEQRAERFGDYSESRAADAEAAHKAVHAIADNIPLGQPILVGHHSERHARRDAEKIENGMRRAVKMWQTSEYWKYRAAGAIRHAKYKERPDVRARRIKTLEAEQRKTQRSRDQADKFLKAYRDPEAATVKLKDGRELLPSLLKTYESGLSWDHRRLYEEGKLTYAEALDKATRNLAASVAHCDRWLNHYTNRIEYERAMLAEDGGTETDRNKPEAGGGCKCWAGPRGGYAYIQKVNKVSVTVLDNWGNGGANFTRTIPFDKLHAVISRAEVEALRAAGQLVESADKTGFYLHESAPDPQPTSKPPAPDPQPEENPAAKFETMRDTLKAGIKVVSAPQLFPTPPELAALMVEMAEIEPGHTVLEPSAGTGNILRAIWAENSPASIRLTAVEVNRRIVDIVEQLKSATSQATDYNSRVFCGDFLEQGDNLQGPFDRVLMNPPFENAADIKHITHALTMLKPGGILVAICANGPRQNEQLKPLTEYWEDLSPGTFAGTDVRAALLVIRKPAPEPEFTLEPETPQKGEEPARDQFGLFS